MSEAWESSDAAPGSQAVMSKAARKLNWKRVWLDNRRAAHVHQEKLNEKARARKYETGEVLCHLTFRSRCTWFTISSSHPILLIQHRQANRHEWQEEKPFNSTTYKVTMREHYKGQWNKKPIGKKPSHQGSFDKMAFALACFDEV